MEDCPNGLPDPVLKMLDDAFARAIQDPDFVNVVKRIGGYVVYMNRAQMNRYVKEMFPKVGEIMKTLKAEEEKKKK